MILKSTIPIKDVLFAMAIVAISISAHLAASLFCAFGAGKLFMIEIYIYIHFCQIY